MGFIAQSDIIEIVSYTLLQQSKIRQLASVDVRFQHYVVKKVSRKQSTFLFDYLCFGYNHYHAC